MNFLKEKLPKLLFFASFFLLMLLVNVVPQKVVNAATLLGGSDYIADDTVNEPNVVHNVSFLIPIGGHTIVATDYIRIVMPNYTSITAPTSGSGWSGSPTFGVTGNVAYVTGVTSPDNNGIGISGITATSPALLSDFDITIEITDDISGTTVYDSVTVTPTVKRHSITTSVTINPTNAALEFLGSASPGAFVTILLNASVAGTTVANSSGFYQKTITGLTPATTYSVSIYAEDTANRFTTTVSFTAFTIAFSTVTYSNIILSSTIEANPTTFNLAESTTIFGKAAPSSQVSIYVDNTYTFVVTTNSNGDWSYLMDTYDYPLLAGLHNVKSKQIVLGGYQSSYSFTEVLEVLSCIPADINCDSDVNLTDFSIMLYYWNDSFPANPRADINRDDVVNLTDFSIMLFYWTG